MTTRHVRALAALAFAALLTGCAGGLDGEPSGLNPRSVDLPDGRTVDCILFDGASKAALTCDWGTAQ